MAIYHFSAKVISRSRGASAVAAAAYRSASRLQDERLARAHDFSAKAGVVHSEVLPPPGAPARSADREALWNAVEAREARKDAQLAREVEFALPRELSKTEGIALAREFVQREFVAKGMVADLNVHWDLGADGEVKPHAHVMLALRSLGPNGFGGKVREWNATERLVEWRQAWAELANARLAARGIDARIDARSLKDQGLALEPQNKIGASGARRAMRGEAAERATEHREIARRNGEAILARPEIALAAITQRQSTFTEQDLWRFLHRHTHGQAQFDAARAKVRTSPELLRLGRDGQGRERFTSREMLGVESRLEATAAKLAQRHGHAVAAPVKSRAIVAAEHGGLVLSGQQRDAVDHLVRRGDLALVLGYAGSGKSALLGVARAAWEGQGYRVRGAALAGQAAESLQAGSGISSRTLASLEHAWARGREALGPRDVLVIDEAGLVGSRQLERVAAQAQAAGAKLVLVGDPEQLQAIEAGAAFRALAERHGAVELTEVRRQRAGWQREATRQLATGRTLQALAAYQERGAVRAHATAEAARTAMVADWSAVRREHPGASQLMLAYTRDDVAALNGLARAQVRADGVLGEGQVVQTNRGARLFATGDRIIFLRNERELGVKNGTLGTVQTLGPWRMGVRLDDGRTLAFDLKSYQDLDHGYASTIHKAQGVTVDQAHVLASGHLDRHSTYVALTRHRAAVTLHVDRESFPDERALGRTLGRERAKDATLDYPVVFGRRRGLGLQGGGGLFEGFRPAAARAAEDLHVRQDRLARVQTFARAWTDAARMRAADLPVLPHQALALDRAASALDRERPGLAAALDAVMTRRQGLGRAAARGEPARLLKGSERLLARGFDRIEAGMEPVKSAEARLSPSRGRRLGLER